MDRTGGACRTILICCFLTAITLGAYWQVFHNGFVALDDRQYLLENPHVLSGLNAANVKWAFQAGYASNWHPLTWISHMLDIQVFGLNPRGHHFTGLLLHLINTSLLFVLLKRMTGAIWKSAIVAALFALHPLHVESVAWVSERKDVLSTFFFLLTVMAYTRYAQNRNASVRATGGEDNVRKSEEGLAGARPSKSEDPEKADVGLAGARPSTSKYTWYGLALVFLALGLMSKAMLVTIPFVLMLLDFWPLKRIELKRGMSFPGLARLVVEKIPFAALAVISCVLTVHAQTKGHAVASVTRYPLEPRLANSLIAYCKYLGKTIWPANLAAYYPHAGPGVMDELTDPSVLAAALFLIAISGVMIWLAKRAPFLPVGWFWFLGTLVPVIGIVQVGGQALADRYMYIPSIGLFIAAVWGLDAIMAKQRLGAALSTTLAIAVIIACAAATRINTGYWKNNRTLFEHALMVTKKNPVAQYLLGIEAGAAGDIAAAREHFAAAVESDPSFAEAHYSLGYILAGEGKADAAMQEYGLAIGIKPWYAGAHNALGAMYWKAGKRKEAAAEYSEALRYQPDSAEAHYNLGSALSSDGNDAEAIVHFKEAVRLKPKDIGMLRALTTALIKLKQFAEAEAVLSDAAKGDPGNAEIFVKLGDVAMMAGKPDSAIQHYYEAVRLRPDLAEVHQAMGSIYLGQGKAIDAEQHFTQVLKTQTNNVEALTGLGRALVMQGKHAEAEGKFQAVTELIPTNSEAHVNLATALMVAGKTNEAAASFGRARELDPKLGEKNVERAKTLADQGQVDAAIALLSIAIWLEPANSIAQENLGLLLAQTGKIDEAIKHFQEGVRLKPDEQAYHNLGLAYYVKGDVKTAVSNYEQAIKIAPDWPVGLNDLAWILATNPEAEVRNGTKAVELAEHACQINGGKDARYWGTLDAAYAETGRFVEAIRTAEKAKALATDAGQKDIAEAAEKRVTFYQQHKPFRQ